MKKYVIYSAMVGAYDDILQPQVVDERFDYILFCNEIHEKQVGVWQVRSIAYHNDDRTRICRYVKTHPEELLPEYEVSIWMDSNIQVRTAEFYNLIIKLDRDDCLISSTYHPSRQCIYDEAFAVVDMRVEYEDVVIDWCHQLRRKHYPRHNGLCETGILYRKHHEQQVVDVDAMWWNYIVHYSRRDQLSFNYVLWERSLPFRYIFGIGNDVRKVECVNIIKHKDGDHNDCPLRKNEAWLMRHYWKHRKEKDVVRELYFKLYAWPFPKFWIALAGQCYRIKDRILG